MDSLSRQGHGTVHRFGGRGDTRPGERVPFPRLADARRLLSELRLRAGGVAELRRVLTSAVRGAEVSRWTDGEVLEQLAMRMVRGEVRVFAQARSAVVPALAAPEAPEALGPREVLPADEIFLFDTVADNDDVFTFHTTADGSEVGAGGDEAVAGEDAANGGGGGEETSDDAPFTFEPDADAEPLVLGTDAWAEEPLVLETDATNSAPAADPPTEPAEEEG